ncbi:MAG: universal stress protein [Actinomycetota bacterium]|nr:universal stress protein [Actinomycetota bacterium]
MRSGISESHLTTPPGARRPRRLRRIAAAVDARPGGQDAAALGAALAGAGGAELVLASVEPDLLRVLPGCDATLMHRETLAMLSETQRRSAASARTWADHDRSVAHGLQRMVRAERRDLLVVGSSARARAGEVAIGRLTRGLLHDLPCPVAIAPSGLADRSPLALREIAVGYDGGLEAQRALALAAGLALASGARLSVCGVVDDRIPSLGWPQLWPGAMADAWQETMAEEEAVLRERIQTALEPLALDASAEVLRGRPAAALLRRSRGADLLVIGSRRWGAPARVILGGTGEGLAHGARCALLVVPRATGRI